MRPTTSYLTKRQATQILHSILGDPSAKLITKKGEVQVICHASTGEQFQCDLQEFRMTDRRSDCNERLWAFTQSSREGRQFEQTVHEAHVVALKNHLQEQQRLKNLAKYEAIVTQ